MHEGSIENLISALNLSPNEKLSKALIKFQEGGSEKYLTENFPEEKEILCRELPKYNEKLIAFFIFGDNSPLITNPIQIADMILYTHNIAIWNKQEYIETYNLKYSKKGQFGTPFKWTYPSKKRGAKIQIKAFTNNE